MNKLSGFGEEKKYCRMCTIEIGDVMKAFLSEYWSVIKHGLCFQKTEISKSRKIYCQPLVTIDNHNLCYSENRGEDHKIWYQKWNVQTTERPRIRRNEDGITFGHVTHPLVTSGRVRFRERLVTFGFEWEIVCLCVCVCVNLSFLILLKSNMIGHS